MQEKKPSLPTMQRVIEAAATQRNAAQNEILSLVGELADRDETIEHLKSEIATLTERIAAFEAMLQPLNKEAEHV